MTTTIVSPGALGAEFADALVAARVALDAAVQVARSAVDPAVRGCAAPQAEVLAQIVALQELVNIAGDLCPVSRMVSLG